MGEKVQSNYYRLAQFTQKECFDAMGRGNEVGALAAKRNLSKEQIRNILVNKYHLSGPALDQAMITAMSACQAMDGKKCKPQQRQSASVWQPL